MIDPNSASKASRTQWTPIKPVILPPFGGTNIVTRTAARNTRRSHQEPKVEDAGMALRLHRHNRNLCRLTGPQRRCYRGCINILESEHVPDYLRVATLHILSRVTYGPARMRNRLTEAKTLLDTLGQDQPVAKLLKKENARLVKWSEGPELEDQDKQEDWDLDMWVGRSKVKDWEGGALESL